MNELVEKKETALQDDSLFSVGKLEHAYRVAKLIASTQLVPKQYQNKPEDVLVACEFGRRLGLGELQAVQNIAVINGKPTMWGDAVLACCQGHPDFVSITESPIKDKDGATCGFECTLKRAGYEQPIVRQFTVDDAKRAGLWGKQGPWTQYPKRMLQLRARAFALRDGFADALSGIQVREEVEDYQIKEINPKPAKAHDAESRLGSILQAEQ
jgi:hypothetical protein